MAILQLPVTSNVLAYKFKYELEGTVYSFNFRYNTRVDKWVFDILTNNEEPLVEGRPVFINYNLIGRFRDERLPPGTFICIDTTGNKLDPDDENFGVTHFFLYEEEVTT